MQPVNPITTVQLLRRILTIGVLSCFLVSAGVIAMADDGALAGHRHRVVVSTDVGGTDPDDFQSMVHLLVYADMFRHRRLRFFPVRAGPQKASAGVH